MQTQFLILLRLRFEVNAFRGRGRPRTAWSINITACTGREYHLAARKTQNRQEWRTLNPTLNKKMEQDDNNNDNDDNEHNDDNDDDDDDDDNDEESVHRNRRCRSWLFCPAFSSSRSAGKENWTDWAQEARVMMGVGWGRVENPLTSLQNLLYTVAKFVDIFCFCFCFCLTEVILVLQIPLSEQSGDCCLFHA